MQKMFWNLCMDPNEIFGSNFKADCDLSYFCGLHFQQVPKPCHMRLSKGGCHFQRANSMTWYPPGYSFDLSSIRNWKQTFLKRLEVAVDLHTVIKGWRKMAVKTRSDKLGQSWKKDFSPMSKGIFKSTAKWSFFYYQSDFEVSRWNDICCTGFHKIFI